MFSTAGLFRTKLPSTLSNFVRFPDVLGIIFSKLFCYIMNVTLKIKILLIKLSILN